jgi:D-alanyl-lipoteichoic acid acyltransferase DltB (MBOAT superfamily)
MLFNSYGFLLAFLPLTIAGYFLLGGVAPRLANAWLVAASIFFYGWWDARYVALLAASIAVNFAFGRALSRRAPGGGALLALGVAFNLLLLGYYKYADFFVANVDALTSLDWALPRVVLPLGISFFTFTQIAYLADCRRGLARDYDWLNYGLFVTFFPHLLAGPILHHSEMMPQFADANGKRVDWDNFSRGLALLAIGLAKKVLIADTLATWANAGFADVGRLSTGDAWIATLAYTLQIYFDFSGYTDMALGMARMLNIHLPQNFNSPYRSTSIRDFWRRWHMTLSRFLRDYLYIPLGGNRAGEARALLAIAVTFVLGGLWHGANWTFVAWGALNGAALLAHRWWARGGMRLPDPAAWALTFFFVCLCWVFFRAHSLADAMTVLRALFGGAPSGISTHFPWAPLAHGTGGRSDVALDAGATFGAFLLAFALALKARNSAHYVAMMRFEASAACATIALFCSALPFVERVREFLYFNF